MKSLATEDTEDTEMKNKRKHFGFFLILSLCSLCPLWQKSSAGELRFERVVIDGDFPGGYQVEVADVNGDKQPDLVAVGGGTCAWYENPSWTKRIVSSPAQTPGIISSATADLDGDGRAEIAIAYEFAMNEPKKGKLALALQGATPDGPWTLKQIADVGSIHRVRWGEFDGDFTRPELVVAPIFGPAASPPTYGDPPRIAIFQTGPDPRVGQWKRFDETGRTRHPVLHAIEVTRAVPDRDISSVILTADNLGVTQVAPLRDFRGWHKWLQVPGAIGEPPHRGCSEVHRGRFADGRMFYATIEPWHGRDVVVYLARFDLEHEAGRFVKKFKGFVRRTVLDGTLAEGHALWVADVDGDGDDEVFAGHRGKDHRVSAYDYDGKVWNRTVLDTDIAAQDLRGGDLDGDGTPDVVAIGGATHNVVWYRFR